MVPLSDSGWDYKLGLPLSSDKSVYFQYHLFCQPFPDNGGDNKLFLFQSFQQIISALEMVPLNDTGRDNKLGLIPSSDKSVYFQYHLNCQHFPDNGGDNKRSLFKSNQWIVFAFETAPLADNGREFKVGLLRLSHKSMYFQYHLFCQHFPDNGGDNKLFLFQSFQQIISALKMVPLNDSGRDYKLGLLPSCDKSVYFHYHLNCQHFPDKTGDNKRSLFQSIQLIVFAFQMVPLNDNGRDNKLGFIPSSDENVYFQYHLNCLHFPDNKGDNKQSLFQSIKYIVFAFETSPLHDNGREFKVCLLRLSHKSVYFQYHLFCQHFPDNGGDNKRLLFQSFQ